MADRRRRRRNSSNTESEYSEGEDTPEVKDEKPVKKEIECDSEVTQGEEDTSEYDSTTEGYDEEETEEEEDVTEEAEDDDVIVEDGLDEDLIEEERQRGDGEEEPNGAKSLDDDEDKKNPAYIPRKGAFYEHDTRLGDEVKEVNEETGPKKKLWTDVGKWDHDRYNPDQQRPKSRDEIIAIYGYDIRSHEKPPESFPRGDKTQRHKQDRRKQLGDYISPGGDQRSYDRPYRGRRGGAWRGSPRGRGWQPLRRSGNEMNSERGERSYTDLKNARNVYNAGPRGRPGMASEHRQWTSSNHKGSRINAVDERASASEDSLSNPPDVVPAGHAHRMEKPNDHPQSRPRYRQAATGRDDGGQNHVDKTSRTKDTRAKGNPAHGQDPNVAKLSKNVQRISLDDKTTTSAVSRNTSSQDVMVSSIYPPVTSQPTTSTMAGSERPTTSLTSQVSDDNSSVMPPLTRPHKSAPTNQSKPADASQGKAKQTDSTRTKRYSTQRQRPPQEVSGYGQENTRETTLTQTPIPTQSAPIAHGQAPVCTPVPQYYGQIYARPPAVFRQPNPVSSQSPPHTLSFPQPPVIQPPLQAVPFTIPASSQVQSPPRLHLGPDSTAATASIPGSVPPNGGQPLLQGPFVPAPVMNYGPPSQQPPQAPASHYQMTGHVPIQFPAPAQGPEPIQIHGGTTYFSHEAPAFRTGTTYFSPEAQQASPSRSAVTRRPKAAIPIINPEDVNSISLEQGDAPDGELYENYMEEGLECAQEADPGAYSNESNQPSAGDDQNIVNDGDQLSDAAEVNTEPSDSPANHGTLIASSQEAVGLTETASDAVVAPDKCQPMEAGDGVTGYIQGDVNTDSNQEQRAPGNDDQLVLESGVTTSACLECHKENEVQEVGSSSQAAVSDDSVAEQASSAAGDVPINVMKHDEPGGENANGQAATASLPDNDGCQTEGHTDEDNRLEPDATPADVSESEHHCEADSPSASQPAASQSKEKIVTEIKLVYTQAPET